MRPKASKKNHQIGLQWAAVRSHKYHSRTRHDENKGKVKHESAVFHPRYASALRQLPSPILIKRSSNYPPVYTLP
ncbi:hypothetical protein CEXT_377881 [Caerostris extrusa]|uniref:Uncharacterized protein n=1 Tax=Caerostris extrusa TaxID=172846 RepID=A0AAV4NQB0_CAEEX|nr:hypothetical protein CEXT_377881 [Caerostris extrusa]